ncbi:sigma-54-dependent transcriptional regulator [Zooshikella ganghwensis]|uniref:Sigma-54-dependent Fis family transcriptional regulator n=1 Tax=Zooshikella ganghwensis TaxID=202772 RepID=A0A4P9VNN4_9GAMM|nr:sigma-54 dependent transcriptional regulator [Zooshikella ganghwensis]RDH43572.1 sigma-54-dependent Fis family transcriptional regulator [Zooshikella ganghwensis]
MAKITILIVEDDPDLREALADTLALTDFSYLLAEDGQQAIQLLQSKSIDMVVSDVNMPEVDGYQLLQWVRQHAPQLPVLLMTAYGSVSQAVEAMKQGAVDYLVKPFEPDALLAEIRRVLQGTPKKSCDEPVAEEESSRQLLLLARKVAATDSTVLITGESGTGKEVLAQYIHRHSPRNEQPFVAINCAAIPENMLEATLFGHEKGAFTGAYSSSPGKFELANNGTLLLDEITEMPLSLQAKLLRVLQEREVERVGGRKTIRLDVRIIATTNREMLSYVQRGEFREDLYYRLCVFPLMWQPLRARPNDIVPLAERLLAVHCRKLKHPIVKLSSEAKKTLLQHAWPGNVRELDNAIQRALILQQGNLIRPADLCLAPSHAVGQSPVLQTITEAAMQETMSIESKMPPVSAASKVASATDNPLLRDGESPVAGGLESDIERAIDTGPLGEDLKQREYELIIDALRAEGGRRKETALKLGISPRTLRYKLAKMREQGIDIETMIA